MAVVRIDNFGGLNTKKDPKKPPFWSALKAENCFLDGGALDVFYNLDTANAAALSDSVPRTTIYNLDGTTFLEWTVDVDVAASPLEDDSTKRVYYSGPYEPRVTNLSLATCTLTLDGQLGLVVTWGKTAVGDAAFFRTIMNPNRVVLADDFLEYDVWIGATSAPALTSSDGGVLLKLNTGSFVSNLLATDLDQNGFKSSTPAGSAAMDPFARGKWYSRKIPIGGVGVTGNTITQVMPGGDSDGIGTHACIFRKIRFTNGAGTDRQAIWPPVLTGSTFIPTSLSGPDISTLAVNPQTGPVLPYPAQNFVLGLPLPPAILSAVASGGTGSDQDRAYVYTELSPWGEEGPPSDPISVVAKDTNSTVVLERIGVTSRFSLGNPLVPSGNAISAVTFVGVPSPGFMEFTFAAGGGNHSSDYMAGDRAYLSSGASVSWGNRSYVVSESGTFTAGEGVRVAANCWPMAGGAMNLFRVAPVNSVAIVQLSLVGLTQTKIELATVEGFRVGEQVMITGAGNPSINDLVKIVDVQIPQALTPYIVVDKAALGVYTGGGTVTRVARHNTGQTRISNVEADGSLTVESTAQMKVGDRMLIIGVQGAYQMNGVRTIAAIPGPGRVQVTLPSSMGAYTKGGVAVLPMPFAFDEYVVAGASSTGGPYPGSFLWTFQVPNGHDLEVEDMIVGYDFVGAQEACTVMVVLAVTPTTVAVSTACALSAYVSGGVLAPCGLQSRKRLYRTATGTIGAEFQLVDEIPGEVCSFTDTFNDVDLGDVLISDGWIQPPTDLYAMQVHPHGFLQGLSGNTLRQSEPDTPHAWPLTDAQEIPARPVGLGITGLTAVAFTHEVPYLFTGADPINMRRERLDVGEACTSKGSIVSTGRGVSYRGKTGMFLVGYEGGGTNSTREFQPDSEYLGSPDVTAAYWSNKLIWITRGTMNGFLLDPAGGEHALVQFLTSVPIYDLHVSPVDGVLWASYVDGGQAKRAPLFSLTSPPARFDYETQYIRFPKPVALGYLQLDFDWAVQSATLKAREATIIANHRMRASAFGAINDLALNEVAAVAGSGIVAPYDPDTTLIVPAERYLKATVIANPDSADNTEIVFDDFVVNDDPVRMADGVKSDVWQVKLVGNCEVSAVMLASSIRELRQV